MAAILNDQLDFIFYFYGLAFLLLGATCWAISRRYPGERYWTMLAAFGLIHGTGEWLDLSALILGDSPAYQFVRIIVMTASFVFLAEFGRLQVASVSWVPGRWAYLPILSLIVLVWQFVGLTEAGVASRYTLGFLGGLGASIALGRRARRLSGPGRSYAIAAALGLTLYSIAAGLVVPAAPFWPADVVNYAGFTALTGVPIQLIRAVLACWIALGVWAIWGHQLASDVLSETFLAYLRRQFLWTAGTMSIILLVGWVLTERLGEIYRHNVESEASGDIDLLASRFAGELATADALVKTLAGSPSIREALERRNVATLTRARELLDLHVDAGRAEAGYILDASEIVVAASGVLAQRTATELMNQAREGSGIVRTGFVFDAVNRATIYNTSRVIAGDGASPVGAAALIVSVEGFAKDLEGLNRPYYFVNPHGIVVLSNVSDSSHRTLWPLDSIARAESTRSFGSIDVRPITRGVIEDAKWTESPVRVNTFADGSSLALTGRLSSSSPRVRYSPRASSESL